jgi:hypothetical protein
MSENSFKGVDTGEHLTDLKNAILRAFPDVVFDGQITPHDGEWPNDLTESAYLRGSSYLWR